MIDQTQSIAQGIWGHSHLFQPNEDEVTLLDFLPFMSAVMG